MLDGRQIAFVGPGVMAEAMLIGLTQTAGVPANRITLAGPRQTRLDQLAERYGVSITSNNHRAVVDADIVVVSVKPQSLRPVLADLRGAVPEGALVLSIVAGVRLQTLTGGLQHPAVVRSMPNTPARVGEGITVWTASEGVVDEQREQARLILAALGQEIFVADENYLDMATALSGTGPSYVYLFMEAMVDAGVHLGFPRRIAEQLVVQTVKGSVAYYEHSPRHLARLRNDVTSPGGTSAAALYYLEKAGFRTALSRAIWAAYERSSALGRSDQAGHLDDV
jgi:pyrroline-5-carboxylate reductase